MNRFCNCIEDRIVYPILIKNHGRNYLTLYYYTEYSDSVIHNNKKRILYFQSDEYMRAFCMENDLQTKNDTVEYNFDAPIENPIDFTRVLDNWNLLNTIAKTFKMFFEGDRKKYTSLYDYLFRLNMPSEPISATYRLVCEKDYKNILKVFRKKDRFLKLFELYQ